ncbi:hypothetical protein [Streptomyces sp. F-7]|uniref:hypothetical protein n=1 Tax=Streptomyces sp. F-7 TaxID=573566 RepID=UPI00159EF06F
MPRHASTASLLRLVERGFATRHRVTAVGFPDAAGVPRGTPLNDGAGTPTRAPRGVRGALVTGRMSRVWGVGQAGQEAVSTCT